MFSVFWGPAALSAVMFIEPFHLRLIQEMVSSAFF